MEYFNSVLDYIDNHANDLDNMSPSEFLNNMLKSTRDFQAETQQAAIFLRDELGLNLDPASPPDNITLMHEDDAHGRDLFNQILEYEWSWWIREGQYVGHEETEIYDFRSFDDRLAMRLAIRPVLTWKSGQQPGKYFLYGNKLWYMYNNFNALCVDRIGIGAFDTSNCNAYCEPGTTIYSTIHNWLRKARKG